MRILCHVLSVETDTDGATSQTELLRGAKTERIVLRRQRKQQDSLSELKGDITCGGTRVEIYSPTCVRLKDLSTHFLVLNETLPTDWLVTMTVYVDMGIINWLNSVILGHKTVTNLFGCHIQQLFS